MSFLSVLLSAPQTANQLFAKMVDNPGDDDNLARIKLILGVLGIIALIYEASRESEGNPISLKWKKMVGGAFAVLGMLSYFQYFKIGYPDFFHRWEFFHYYVGSKYYNEIGYEGIYVCAAVAESELPEGSAHPGDKPRNNAKVRKLRDLRVNLIKDTTEYIEHPEQCKEGKYGRQAFTPERWEAFKKDVAFYRRTSLGNYWNDMQKDHGYNPPPVWGITGRLFATLVAPSTEQNLKLLSCIDPILFAAMFGFVAWAFGWRVMCVAIFFWGTQDASPFYWTGGAFLRQDWLFYAVVSACMVRKQKFFWGGAFLAYATLLRVFPIMFYPGFFVYAASYAWHAYKKDPSGAFAGGFMEIWRRLTDGRLRQYALGSVVALAVLGGASLANSGFSSWRSFAHHIGVHNSTPLTNHMGWKTIVAHSAEGRMEIARDPRRMDPFEKWKDNRRERVKKLWYIHYGGIAIMMGMFSYAIWRLKNLWIIQALGVLPTTILVELTDYYYSYFIYGAMLSKGRRPIEIALLLASVGSEWAHVNYGMFDDRFTAMSVVFVLLSVFMVAMYMRRPWLSRGEITQPIEESAPGRVPSIPPPATR